MCGLAAIINFNKENNFQLSDIEKMTSSLRHRGPDDEGYVVFQSNIKHKLFYGRDTNKDSKKFSSSIFDKKELILSSLAFGHRRLSIQDLSSSGHQPMSYSNDRYWIVYNGEVYNFFELKYQLEKKGYKFKTSTDTEVILASYQEWGPACQKKFNGEWAILIYDKIKQNLFVSRDRFGIKPLYYYKKNNLLIFSSEIKALHKHSKVKKKYNLDYLKSYIHSGAKDHLEETNFENIYRFPFAHYAIINLKEKSQLKFKRYWKLKFNSSNEKICKIKLKKISDRYYKLLKESVRIRLRSDVPVACALSGGLDSSSIVYLVKEIYNDKKITKQVETFSLIHKGKDKKEYDESSFIKLLRNSLKLKSRFIFPKSRGLYNTIKKIILYTETPPSDFLLSSHFTFKLASRYNYKVTLNGQGADEQLAGYSKYLRNYIYHLKSFNLLKQYLFILLNFKLFFHEFKMITVGLLPKKMIRHLNTFRNLKKLNAALVDSINTTLVSLLHYADRYTMNYSIEGRMPFMDHRLVEFNASVPANYKIHDGWTKYYARLAFNGKLPKQIVWRKDKMGWPTPDQKWLEGSLSKKYFKLLKKSELINNFLKLSSLKLSNPKIKIFVLLIFEKYNFLSRCKK